MKFKKQMVVTLNTNIRVLRLNFAGYEFFIESNSPNILALCKQTWTTQLILAISL